MLHILTLSWNGLDKLTKLKQSLLPSLKDINYIWHIKSNGCTDGTVEEVSTWGENIKLYAYPDNNQNFSQGMNYLFDKSNAKDDDFILFLNNDVEVKEKKSIKNMMAIMKDPTVGIVGCRLLFSNSDVLQHAGVVFDAYHKGPLNFRNKEKDDPIAGKNRIFQAVTAACCLTKASIYKRACTDNASGIGGMDEKYHWSFDDVDFCLAVNYSLKKKVVYCGDAVFFHEESATLKKRPTNKMFMKDNLTRLQNKWGNHIVYDRANYTSTTYKLYK